MSVPAFRKTYKVTKRAVIGYDMSCLLCSFVSTAWDYRSNALKAGFDHWTAVHKKGKLA